MHRQTLASMFEKAKSANLPLFTQNGCLFMWGAYFCMCVYKCNVVPEIKMGAYIYEVLILCGCLLSRFYGSSKLLHYDLSSYQAKVVSDIDSIPLCSSSWKIVWYSQTLTGKGESGTLLVLTCTFTGTGVGDK